MPKTLARTPKKSQRAIAYSTEHEKRAARVFDEIVSDLILALCLALFYFFLLEGMVTGYPFRV